MGGFGSFRLISWTAFLSVLATRRTALSQQHQQQQQYEPRAATDNNNVTTSADANAALLCRCELQGENLYRNVVETGLPLRIGDYYVLPADHSRCVVVPSTTPSTPLIDAVLHGLHQWAATTFAAGLGNGPQRKTRLLNNHDSQGRFRRRIGRHLFSTSTTTDSGFLNSQNKHGIVAFPCPTMSDRQDTQYSYTPPYPGPVTYALPPSVQLLSHPPTNRPTLVSTNCFDNIKELNTVQNGRIYADTALGTIDMEEQRRVVACDDHQQKDTTVTTTLVDQSAVWFSVRGNGQTLVVSTCTEETTYETSVSIITGTCDAATGTTIQNTSCVETNQTQNSGDYDCPFPIADGATTVEWVTNPNTMYWILVQARNESSASNGQFGLTLRSAESPPLQPSTSPMAHTNIFDRPTIGLESSIPPSAFVVVDGVPVSPPPDGSMSPSTTVYQGVGIFNDNHSCESAIRLKAPERSDDDSSSDTTVILGTTIGAPAGQTITCWTLYDSPTVWFTIVGTGQILDVTMNKNFTRFEPLLSVITGDSCNSTETFTCLATGLDYVAWQTQIGQSYWILLQGRGDQNTTGDYGMAVDSHA